MAILGFIREADTEVAANTAAARGRRSVAAARAGLPPPEGNAPRSVAPARAALPPSGQQAPQTSSRSASFVSALKENPFEVVGLILSNIAAGTRGQELPTERIKRNKLVEDRSNLQRMRVILDLVDKGVGQFAGMDLNDPRTIAGIDAFAGQFTPTLGEGFRDTLTSGIELAQERGRDALKGLAEHSERVFKMCGLDRECILDAGRDSALMKRFDQTADQERRSAIIAKFKAIGDAVRTDPNGNAALAALAEKGITSTELRQVPPGFGFTEDELRTLDRDKELQDMLRPAGFRPPDLARIEAEAEAQAAATAKFRAPDAFNAQVEALVQQGVPRSVAVKVKTGAFKAATDDRGRASIVDVTSGEQIFPPKTERAETPRGTKEPEIVGGAEGTGGSAVLKNAVNSVTDFFGAGLQFEDAAQATDQLERLRTFTTLGLAQDLAGRDTNMVRSLIIDLFPEPSSLKIGDARSLSKLKRVRDQIAFELDGQRPIAENPGEFTPKMAQTAVAAVHNLGRLLEMYNGVIDNWNVKPGKGKKPKIEEGTTATNAAGDKIIFRGGKWVPVR